MTDTAPTLPDFALEQDIQVRVKYALEVVIYTRLLVLAFLSLSGIFIHQAQLAHFGVVGGALFSSILTYTLLRRGFVRHCAVWMILDAWFWITLTAIISPLIEETVISAYIIVIFLTGALLGRQKMFWVGCWCGISSLALLQLDQAALLGWQVEVHPLTGWMVELSYFVAAGCLFYFAHATLQDILTKLAASSTVLEGQNLRLRQEIAAHEAVQLELRDHRENLLRILENAPILTFILKSPTMISLMGEHRGRPSLHQQRQRQLLTLFPYLNTPHAFAEASQLLPGKYHQDTIYTPTKVYDVRYLPLWRDNKPLGTVMGVATDITGQTRAEEKNLQYIKQLESLSDITLILTGEHHLTYLYKLVVAAILDTVPNAETASLMLHDKALDRLMFQAGAGFSDQELETPFSFAPYQSAVGYVFSYEDPYIVYDAQQDEHFTPIGHPKLDSIKSSVLVPLAFRGQTIGVLSADNFTRTHAFDEPTLELMMSFATATASAAETARLYQEARQARDYAQNLARQVIRTQEDEQRRIGLELHDHFGQALFRFMLDLKRLQAGLEHPDQRDLATSLLTQVRSFSEEIRLLTWQLRPEILDEMGLSYALEDCARMFHQAGTQISINLSGEESWLSEESHTAIYRCVQEALKNARHYAQASQIQVQIKLTETTATVIIEDNGCGFEVPSNLQFPHKRPGGNGLSGIRQRANLLGGSCDIHSEIGKGTRLTIIIPLYKEFVKEEPA